MATPVQWTADTFWKQLQWVAAQGKAQKARLAIQKSQLQEAYSAARIANDAPLMAQLNPLIHQNSVLRVRYMDLARSYNDLLEQARNFLAQHGIDEPPVLAGLGQLETIIVPVAWVLGAVAVVAIVHEIDSGIKAIDKVLEHLGPLGKATFALLPLILGGIAALILIPGLGKRLGGKA